LVDVFGDDLRPYSEKELQKVDGIGQKLAQNIKKFADNY
jgi:helicase